MSSIGRPARGLQYSGPVITHKVQYGRQIQYTSSHTLCALVTWSVYHSCPRSCHVHVNHTRHITIFISPLCFSQVFFTHLSAFCRHDGYSHFSLLSAGMVVIFSLHLSAFYMHGGYFHLTSLLSAGMVVIFTSPLCFPQAWWLFFSPHLCFVHAWWCIIQLPSSSAHVYMLSSPHTSILFSYCPLSTWYLNPISSVKKYPFAF